MSRKNAEGSTKKPGKSTRKASPKPAAKPAAASVSKPSAASAPQKTKPVPAAKTPKSGAEADLDRLGELPRSYGSDTIFLIAQEPHWLFTYWDIDISRHPGGATFLRVYEGGEAIEAEIEVPFETRNWYIPVKRAGGDYTVEIGFYRGPVWHIIARSASVATPPDSQSSSEQFQYATIPLHLSFQKLIGTVQDAVKSGETLIQALARLQKDGKLFAFGAGAFPDISDDERLVLEALLGGELMRELSSGAFASEELERRIRLHLEEKLNSEGSSALLAGGSWTSAGSSLFEALGAASSWSPAAISSWAAAALSSWGAQAPGRSRWAAEVGEALSSAAPTSWGAAEFSSWLQAAQSSWEQAALSSWNQAPLSSWNQAESSSWTGASENLSSFGRSRNFFMNVNAEVIFYGGTDPRAKVTIDGKPITLNPDGTFRHHFIFPDGAYEIPIVATSPDGVETRSAILRFDRGTQKHGHVDAAAQPPLAAPMGARP